jgi:PAS domain S-box-containing protein
VRQSAIVRVLHGATGRAQPSGRKSSFVLAHDTGHTESADEVQALAEAVLEAARAAGLGVTVSFDDGVSARHVYVNDAAAEILGQAAEELLGSATLSMFCPEERSRMAGLMARRRDEQVASGPVETVILRHDGERVPVEIATSVVPLGGEPATVLFLRDIRERKAAEETLLHSERRFRRLIEAAPDAIGVSRGARFVYVNPALALLCGRSTDELVGREIADVVHVDDRELVAATYHSPGRGLVPSRPLEYRILRPDGEVVYVETSSISIEYEGRPCLLDFMRDTTTRTLLQTRLALRDRMATLGQLSASVAHEINNPLAYATLNVEAIVGQLRRLSNGHGLSDEIESSISAARDGLARVATIVRDLRELCASNSTERWPVDVCEVIDAALNVAAQAVGARCRVERRFGEVPALETDPTKLGQILLNLILNASESFPLPNPALNVVTISVESPHPDELVVSVSDNGPGISRQDLERIFEPFFTTKSRGMGLGLAICQTLAASLRGVLRVESALGHGTTFLLRLPALGVIRPRPAEPNKGVGDESQR